MKIKEYSAHRHLANTEHTLISHPGAAKYPPSRGLRLTMFLESGPLQSGWDCRNYFFSMICNTGKNSSTAPKQPQSP